MIDAREDVLSSAPAAGRRRGEKVSTTTANSRGMKPAKSESKKSLRIERIFSDAKVNPFDQIEWDCRTAEITDDAGKIKIGRAHV